MSGRGGVTEYSKVIEDGLTILLILFREELLLFKQHWDRNWSCRLAPECLTKPVLLPSFRPLFLNLLRINREERQQKEYAWSRVTESLIPNQICRI